MKSAVVASIIGSLLTILATILLACGLLKSTSFVVFCGLTFLLALAVLGFPRLKELDLRNLKMILNEAKEVRKEIYLKEEDLKRHSVALSKVVAFTGGMMMRIGDEAAYLRRMRFIRIQCEKVMRSLNASEEEISDAFHILDLLRKRDEADAAGNKAVVSDVDTQIKQLVDDEIAASEGDAINPSHPPISGGG